MIAVPMSAVVCERSTAGGDATITAVRCVSIVRPHVLAQQARGP